MHIFYTSNVQKVSLNKLRGFVTLPLVLTVIALGFFTPVLTLNKLAFSNQAQAIIQSTMIGMIIGVIVGIIYNTFTDLNKVSLVSYTVYITADKYLYIYENIAPEDINHVWREKTPTGKYLFIDMQEIELPTSVKTFKTPDGLFTLDCMLSDVQGHFLVKTIELGAKKCR